MSLVEAIRGVAVLSRLFGTGPMVAYRASRAGLDRTAARAIILSHVNSVRRWARVELDVAPVPKRAGSGFVLVYNQTSIADDLGNLDVLWRFADYSVLASEYGRIPFFGSAARRVGIVLMKRGDRQATDETLRRLARWAAEGSVVSVAAEGRLSPGGEVGHFKRGAFLVAIRAGVPVVPMTVWGGRSILRPGSLRLRAGMLTYRFGSPISVDGLTEDDAPAMAEEARRAVARLLAGARGEIGGSTTAEHGG
ncbi:MAG: 1-acyl-sn-glycerol-3-phosphate acyltransferase [Gemmatimonadetes bacterium]|nr:1-acyl-sn-glycerol-3-phosphate acyltransferase [Gemmatimonadota bacterium]